MEAYWYWLCHEMYLDRMWARRLLERFGSPKAVFEAEEGVLRKFFPKETYPLATNCLPSGKTNPIISIEKYPSNPR